MAIIHCTQKLLKEMGLTRSDLVDQESTPKSLGSWYANLLIIEHKKSVIFTNERTLLTFLVVGLKRAEIRQLEDVLRQGLTDLLATLDVKEAQTTSILAEHQAIVYGRTSDRSVLGSQNDLASMAQYKIAYDGGLQSVDVADVNLDLNETPMSRLGMASPSAAFQAWLNGDPIPSSNRKKTPATRKKKPQRATADEVTIRRRGHTAIVQPTDAAIATTHLEVGPRLSSMSDNEVLALFNATIDARDERAARHPDIVREIPPGHPQIRYHKRADQWTPRGSALRCLIDDMDGQAVITIDDYELSIEEFGRLLTTYSGWGMRIKFMSEESLHHRPPLVLTDPEDADDN